MNLKVISTGSKEGNCYVIQTPQKYLLLDCGCDFKKILEGIGYAIKNVSVCLATHKHSDHIHEPTKMNKNGIPIYTNDETKEHFVTFFGERLLSLRENTRVCIGPFTVIPFYVPHDGTPNFAYLIRLPDGQKLLYATDFQYLPYTFKSFKIAHFLIECNHMDGAISSENAAYSHYVHSIRGHSSLSAVKEIIRENATESLKTVTLCHMSDTYSDPETMVREVKSVTGPFVNVQAARSGLTINLDDCPF